MACNACKISGMKHKKHKIGGVSKSAAMETGIIAVTVPIGVIAAQELKVMLYPEMIKPEDTAEDQKTKHMYLNVGTGVFGLALAYGGVYMKDTQPELAAGLIGLGTGMVGQCALKAWTDMRTDAAGGAQAIAASRWTNKAWNDARKEAMIAGNDNNGSGLAGVKKRGIGGNDNNGSGIMGKIREIPVPINTKRDLIGTSGSMSL